MATASAEPTTKKQDATDLLRLAAEADGQPYETTQPQAPAPPEPTATTSPADGKQAQAPAKPTEGTTADGKTTPDGKTAPDATRPTETGAQEGDDQGEGGTPYTQAVKSERRLNEGWKKLNAEKEALAAEKARLEAEKKAIEESRNGATQPAARAAAPQAPAAGQQPGAQAPDINALPDMARRYTAEELEALAKDLESEGDTTNAKLAKDFAGQRRAYDSQLAQAQATQQHATQYQEFRRAWIGNMASAMKENPDLQNRQSPLSQAFEGILATYPLLKQIPDGALVGVNVAKWKLGFDEAEALRGEVAKLQQENKRLLGNVTPAGAGTTPAADPAKTGKAVPTKEELLRAANEADGRT